RQPWEYQFSCGPEAGSNNEPIGPGSSVASETDPMRLVMAAVTTYTSGLPFYTFHSRVGVGMGERFGFNGDQEFSEMPGHDAFRAMKSYMPPGSSGWSRHGHGWAGNPLKIFGDGVAYHMTTDGAQNGCMRNYALTRGAEFVIGPIGCRGFVEFETRGAMTLEVIQPLTGEVLQTLELANGQRFQLSGSTAWILKGRFK
ncbi:MAG TPA: hypothetical protein VFV50_08935, partial [Bdellovibrionales bacterium]|nr:hypothetical protein [Bdellovibrionales bacterium]